MRQPLTFAQELCDKHRGSYLPRARLGAVRVCNIDTARFLPLPFLSLTKVRVSLPRKSARGAVSNRAMPLVLKKRIAQYQRNTLPFAS